MSNYILTRIDAIQQELDRLKKLLMVQNQSDRRTTHLEGLWAGTDLPDELFDEAEKSAFSAAYDWQE